MILVHKVYKGMLVQLVLRAPQEIMEQQEPPVLQELRVQQAQLVLLEPLVLQERQAQLVTQEPPEEQAQQVTPVHKVYKGMLEQLVLQVQQETTELPEQRVILVL